MTLSAFEWALLCGAAAIVVAIVGYLISRDRSSIETSIKSAREEAKRDHTELSAKVSKIDSELHAMALQQGAFITRAESDEAHARIAAEQRAERAELRGFITAWLERIEQAVRSKADKP